ncbi:hypothetical protein EWB00_010810 [Schistosoma japonicum]|uniref:Uncharacterized protein n=1 Tax=Schistosoma japonicum TaxID=6182 RepID=A0A4Z2DN35_SCHJA|nr:hypothetical protein EWB00_010810 [Schistosoma japonicum]
MTKPISILILCDCRESLSEELNDLRKQFTDESNTVKLTDLCDYFSDHILSNSEHFCDLFITFMDLILAHDMTVFVFSESHKRSPNRISELNSTITESPFKLDLSQSHIRTSESPSNCYYLMQLVSLFAGRFTSEASLDQKMFYFFKSSSVNCMESLVCHKRSNVHDFEDWKSIGFIIENKVAKLKQIFQLKSPIYESEFIVIE